MSGSGFNKREDSFEKKFAHDAELRFKVEARRNKMLAAWVGAKCNMTAEEIAQYTSELVRADLKTPGDMDVQHKIHADLKARGVHATEAEIRAEMEKCFVAAAAELT